MAKPFLPRVAAAQVLRVKRALTLCEEQAGRDGSAYQIEHLRLLHSELTQLLELAQMAYTMPSDVQALSGGVDKPAQP